jgi:hypothetical protein
MLPFGHWSQALTFSLHFFHTKYMNDLPTQYTKEWAPNETWAVNALSCHSDPLKNIRGGAANREQR